MDARFSITLLGVIALAVVVGIIAAQSQPHTVAAPAPTSTPTPVPTPLANQVEIIASGSGGSSGLFVPSTLIVHVGQPVTWVNRTGEDHSVAADNGTFSSDVLSPGQSYSWTPRQTGSFPYSDYLDPTGHGIIRVQP